ncbi:hypothetical protein JHK87_031778 [Glycine soja]|nr:hypothetical protein JHK87_031778 [Glycine soja]
MGNNNFNEKKGGLKEVKGQQENSDFRRKLVILPYDLKIPLVEEMVEELEKEIIESRDKIEFYCAKMKELRANQIVDLATSDAIKISREVDPTGYAGSGELVLFGESQISSMTICFLAMLVVTYVANNMGYIGKDLSPTGIVIVALIICTILGFPLAIIVSLGSGPWDQLFGGGNSLTFVVAAISALISGLITVLAIPRSGAQKARSHRTHSEAANVLLDDCFRLLLEILALHQCDANVLLDDYCLQADSHVTNTICGIVGHIAPEYLSTSQSSDKTNVFGFGILLLELITVHDVYLHGYVSLPSSE